MNMPDVIAVVERAFTCRAQGKATMPPKAYLSVEEGDFRAMPCSLPGGAGVKWVSVHPKNLSWGFPTVMGILVYNDPATGYPLAVMDATEITAFRTAATAAIASRYLAREDSRTLGIVGAGQQARTQVLAHTGLFDLTSVKVFDSSSTAVERLVRDLPEHPTKMCSLEETVASDIVCTLTPARLPFVRKEWIIPGTHINAVGADAQGKEELDPSILKEALVVVDDIAQAVAGGEINVPIRRREIRVEDVHATLGDIILGHRRGREDEKAVTVFDSTGLAIEDVAVAQLVYGKARQRDGYPMIDFVESGTKTGRRSV
jgi:alanine dehydrogenase